MTTLRPAAQGSDSPRLLIAIAVAAITFIAVVSVGVLIWRLGTKQEVSLVVRTTPAVRAAVTVDGTARGVAPLELTDLAAGPHRVRIEADGYQPFEEQVDVAGATRLQVPLLPAPASAPVPPPAPTPAVVEPAATPTRTTAPAGGGSTPRPAPAPANQRRPTVPAAEARPAAPAPTTFGMLEVNTIPPSRVLIDGRDTGRDTPVANHRVETGRHRLGLRTADGRVREEALVIEEGRTTRVVRRLE